MKFLRVKNLHCIIDTSEIPLKGINLLLGANSAGKSSFLRVLPLIRQSLDYNKKGPFLWFGERVDFGSFSEAQRKGSEDLTISFGLDVNLNDYVGSRKSPTVSGEFEFVVDSIAHNDYLKGFSFKSAQISVEMGFTSGGRIKRLVVNGKDYSFLSNRILVPTYYHMIPRVRFVNSVRSRKNTQRFVIKESDILEQALEKSLLNGKIDVKSLMRAIESSPLENMSAVLDKTKEVLSKKYPFVSSWFIGGDEFEEFYRLLLIYKMDSLFMHLDYSVSDSLNSIFYIGPYRSAVERYYRIQNIAVREIDPHGDNMPMYVGNLDSAELSSLSQWMDSNFGFSLKPEYSKGHVSLLLFDSDTKEKFNLIDRGFGYSQVLPIIVSLWHILKHRDSEYNPNSVVFAIEQPELHLHPRLLSKLVNVFVKSVNMMRELGYEFSIVLETHSPTLINEIGNSIYHKMISKEDVSLVLFNDAKVSTNGRQIEVVSYSDEGVLENWPLGFLES